MDEMEREAKFTVVSLGSGAGKWIFSECERLL